MKKNAINEWVESGLLSYLDTHLLVAVNGHSKSIENKLHFLILYISVFYGKFEKRK